MGKLRKIISFVIALVMTTALFSGGGAVLAAESNNELKLSASREGDVITVDVKSVKDMIFGGMEITLEFDSDQLEMEAYSDGKLYETQFDTTAYNPNLHFFSLAAGTPFTATPDGKAIISVKYKVKNGFKADTDYVFKYTFDDCFTNKREDYDSIGAVLDITYRENTVSFDLNGGEAGSNDYSDQLVVTGEKASDPGDPTREGYVFKGWKAAETDKDYFNFDTPITQKTTLTADWAQEYEVSYKVTGDAPEGYEVPETVKKLKGDEVTAEVAPESPVTGTKDGVSGTYTFTGWTAPEGVTVEDGKFTMPEKNVEFTGEWKFTPSTHSVSYSVTGDVPEGYTAPGKKTVNEGASVEVEAKANTDKTANAEGVPGTYTFEGWTAPEDVTVEDGKFTMPGKDVEFTGTWTFTEADKHTVKYVVNEEGGKPDNVTGEVPADVTYYEGENVTVAPALSTSSTTNGDKQGSWSFAWDKTGDFEMGKEDVTITGTWTFTETDKHTVKYEISDGDKPDDATITGTVPENADYYAGETVTVADALTTTSTKNGDKDGTWKFTWSRTGSFQMGSEDVTITGTWTFIEADKYTVDTDTANHTYQIFQIFTGDLSSKTVEEGGEEVTKDILTNLVWGENGTGIKGEVVPDTVINALNGVVGETLDKTKLAEIEKYVNTNGTPVKEITASGTASVDLPAGYYLIRDLPDSQDGKDDAYTTYITVVVKDYTVKPKSAKPTVDKKVADGETADYAINQTFRFTLTASLPADTDFAAYEKYKLTFTDTMSSGITFEKIDSVTVDGTAIDSSKYTASASDGQKGGSWTLTIDDIKTAAAGGDITDGCDVVVTYSAHLNEDAVAHSTGGEITADNANTNSAKLTYSNNPNTDGDGDTGETTTEDKVWVFTYKVDNTKMGETNGTQSPLKDAGFKLYSEDGNTEIPLAYDAADNVYYPAAAGAAGVEMKSAADGTFNIKGLDAGTYTLKETTTPDGYNTCDDTKVKISARHQEDSSGTKATLTLSEDSTVNNTIINKSGSELPHTGGIGTTVFYVLGGILVIGAGIVLITRRRMNVQ